MILSEYKCFGPDTPVHPSTVIQEQRRQAVFDARLARILETRIAALEPARVIWYVSKPPSHVYMGSRQVSAWLKAPA